MERNPNWLTAPAQPLHPDVLHVGTVLFERLPLSARHLVVSESKSFGVAAQQPGMTPQILQSWTRSAAKKAFPQASEDQLRGLVFLTVVQALRLPAPPLPPEARERAMGLLGLLFGSIKAIAKTEFAAME